MSQESGNEGTAGGLLDDEQRGICERLTKAEAPHGQRAQALLALDEGATQAAAADGAGLSKGQVKYWLGRFRKLGLGIFPEDLVSQARPETAPTPSGETTQAEDDASVEEEVAPETADSSEAVAVRPKAKTKKSKKGKGKSGKKKKGKSKKAKKAKKQSKKKKAKKKSRKKKKK